jgi:hypothetical protein
MSNLMEPVGIGAVMGSSITLGLASCGLGSLFLKSKFPTSTETVVLLFLALKFYCRWQIPFKKVQCIGHLWKPCWICLGMVVETDWMLKNKRGNMKKENDLTIKFRLLKIFLGHLFLDSISA